MVGVAVVKLTSGMAFEIPTVGRWVVYCAVGWLLGQTVTKDALVVLRNNVVPVMVCVVLFVVFGLVLAWGIWRFTDLDAHTALLATAPGGIAQMGALSAEAKVNVPLVLSVHVLRITSVIVLMTLGNYMTSPTGPIQNLLVRLGLIDGPVFWQSSFWLPMPVIAIINAWKWFGVATVVLLAGLFAIDPQLYEAASLDGANRWQQFRSITFPQLMPQIFFLLVVDVINGLQMFGEVYAIFDIYGGNGHQALTPVLYLYAQAFDRSNMGYASTLGLQLAALIAFITILQFRFVRQDAE
jgi:membrane AbrB-like protein